MIDERAICCRCHKPIDEYYECDALESDIQNTIINEDLSIVVEAVGDRICVHKECINFGVDTNITY